MADITQPAHEQRTGPAHDQISLAQESDAISEVSTNKNFATALLTNSQDPSSNDDRFITTRTELWTYYVFYIGQSGLSLFNFAPTQFQNLLAQQAVNNGNGQCGGDGQPDCRLLFAGKERTVESIVLLSNGISFAIQAALLIAIGSTADYGNGRPLILILSTILSVGVSLGWLGVTKPDQWEIATGMYMAGLIAYQLVQTYYVAVFAGLSRDLPHMRQARQKLIEDSQIVSTTEGNDTDDKATTPAVEKQADSSSSADSDDRMTADKYSLLETMAMNRVSNISFTVCSVGELVVLAVIQGMLYGIHADRDEQSNTTALSAIVAFGGGIQILCSVPYFLAMRWRPGQPLPPGTNYLTAAVKQAFLAAKHLRRLRQTLIYLIFYFLFSDAFNTTVTVISTLQYSSFSYSATDSNILLIVGIAAQAVGIYGFWLIQKKWQLSTLTMFSAVVFFILLLQVWGFIGIFTQRFGFHNKWEFYLYQAYYGLVACPFFAYAYTMQAEVSPKGTEFLFFSLFSMVSKGSSFIAPFITQAIADDTGNASTPFYFLLALSLASCILLWPLDIKKSKIEQAAFIEHGTKDKNLDKSNIVTPQTVAVA